MDSAVLDFRDAQEDKTVLQKTDVLQIFMMDLLSQGRVGPIFKMPLAELSHQEFEEMNALVDVLMHGRPDGTVCLRSGVDRSEIFVDVLRLNEEKARESIRVFGEMGAVQPAEARRLYDMIKERASQAIRANPQACAPYLG